MEKVNGLPFIFPQLYPIDCASRSISHGSYDTWIPASEIEASVEDAPTPEKPRKVSFPCPPSLPQEEYRGQTALGGEQRGSWALGFLC